MEKIKANEIRVVYDKNLEYGDEQFFAADRENPLVWYQMHPTYLHVECLKTTEIFPFGLFDKVVITK